MYPVGYNVNDPAFFSEPGSRYKSEFIGNVQSNGEVELVNSGAVDLWMMHSAQAESCDINNIVRRFQDGDLTVLSRVQGSYADLAGLPKDLRGMSDLIDSLRSQYDILSSDVKAAFPSFNDWLSAAGSEEWTKVMSMRSESEAAPMSNSQPAGGES